MTDTIPPTKDRNYYNMLDDDELLHLVRYPQRDRMNWEELAIVLAERLKKEKLRRWRDIQAVDL